MILRATDSRAELSFHPVEEPEDIISFHFVNRPMLFNAVFYG